MRGILIRTLAASGIAAATWSSSALARAQPPVVEIVPPPQEPPVIRVLPRPPAPPAVVVAPVPPRDAVTWEEVTPNTEVISSGIFMLGLSYGTSIVVGAASDRQSDQFLFVPLAGPWMDLAHRGDCGGFCGIGETTNRALLVANGL